MTPTDTNLPPEDATVIQRAPERGAMEPPYLVIVDGPRRGTRFPLGAGENLLGRGPASHILLEDQSVSRRHCQIQRDQDAVAVQDLESRNGTRVNGAAAQGTVMVGHGDLIQVGIYTLRVITQLVGPEEELAPISDADGEPVERVAEPSMETVAAGEVALEDEGASADDTLPESGADVHAAPADGSRRRRIFFIVAGGVLALVAGGAAWWWGRTPEAPPARMVSRTIPHITPIATTTEPAAPADVPVFVDFAASPMPARVQFQDKDYGMTPIKVNLTLKVGESYTAEGHFTMPEFKEERIERVSFTVDDKQGLIPVFFRAPIGMFKVERIPKEVELTLQGYFAYDQFTPHNATLTDIAYGKPIYVPYGRYVVELRAPREIGASGSFVPDIRFRREIFLTADAPTYAVDLDDAALASFPLEIQTTPSGAEMFIDTQPVGKTPYSGNFPLGTHTLVLRKEGYFEHTQSIENDINVPIRLDLTLKTTPAGSLLVDSHQLILKGRFQEAVEKLSKVFELSPAPVEAAKAQYLLGVAFLSLSDLPTARGYFEQAATHPEFALKAKLGQVRIMTREGQRLEALPLLVDIMLRTDDGAILDEAKAAFKEVSPLKSVIYVESDPSGATVFVNDEPMSTKTPLILPDLGLGNYKLRLELQGYEPKSVNVNLTVHEFNPVIVRLKSATEE